MKAVIPQMEPWVDELEAKAVYEYLTSGAWLTEFRKTQELEGAIAAFTKSPHCIMTVNGTVTLIMAIRALELTHGDEILIPNLTMIACPNAAALLGVRPVLVDVEKQTLCMDLADAGKKITKKTKALMYVSLNGRSGNMKKVMKFCRTHNLHLIEDAAQSLGSYWNGKHLGTFGTIGSFSFSSPKIITTGQGGALVTTSTKLAKQLRLLKDFGRTKGGTDIHPHMGWNFKFNDVQAVIGLVQMGKLATRIKRKKAIYHRYTQGLKDVRQIELIPTDLAQTTPWFIDIYVPQPNILAKYLQANGIGTRPVYPPISSQKIYRGYGTQRTLPVSYDYAHRGLWLPSSSKLTDEQIDFINGTIKKFFSTS